MLVLVDSSNSSLSLRKVTEEVNSQQHQEIGQYGNIRVAVGFSRNMRAYYVNLSDRANGNESVLLTDRSDVGAGGWADLRFAHKLDFISDLHAALDAKGLYLEGNEEELASVVVNLTLQLLERIRNENS
jgi:hypothetical protein